jgi:uncharacterized OB-fold protein
MKGSKCKCGYSTTSDKATCPRCGKRMEQTEWPDEGTVLSFSKLDVVPEGLSEKFHMALVAVSGKGPKVICWSPEVLSVGNSVAISEDNKKYFCNPKSRKK